MKKQVLCAIKKDFKEYMRNKKNLFFSFIVLFLCAMVFCSTKLLPSLIDSLAQNAPQMISNKDTLDTTLTALFPETLSANMGILASDIVIFYGIVVILSTYNLIVKEIVGGKWIFPLSVGYKPFTLILSKGLVYGVGAAFPTVVFYNLYYMIGCLYLYPDYSSSAAILNSLVLGFSMFSIVYITIMLASTYKQPIMSAITMILFISVAPDIFALFSFGKFLPTYILSFLYQSKNNHIELILPLVSIISLATLFTIIAVKKSKTIEVAR